MPAQIAARAVQVPDGKVLLDGDLQVPAQARGLILFAHGSGSSRFSARNRQVASALNEAGFATLLLDLLTPREEAADRYTGEFRFDIPRLGRRVIAAFDWAAAERELRGLPIGCFGASTGAAAALIAAAERTAVAAVVSRGGRPDLAGAVLPRVKAPTLLIVGGDDEPVIDLNEQAQQQMTAQVRLEIVPGATHLFEEPGALERVADLAIRWFERHLVRLNHLRQDYGGREADTTGPADATAGPADTVSIPPDRWAGVLESFSRDHRAWLAHVERDGRPAIDHDRPLKEVRPDLRGAQVVAIRIEFESTAGTSEIRIDEPVALVVENQRGATTALDVEDARGRHTTVRFRVATPEAMLDGVAPGEL